jgi:hypothetical protein
MASLEQIIAVIRLEVDHALAAQKPLPNEVVLEAERVVVTLHFNVSAAQGSSLPTLSFNTKKSDSANNSLTIEFNYGRSGGTSIPPRVTEVSEQPRSRQLTAEDALRVTEQLSKVFGKPGFDSSARATVFREALENLSKGETVALIEELSGASSPDVAPPVKRAKALLQRVCRAGPAGADAGAKLLVQVLRQHEPDLVRKFIAETWKTQEDWLS